MKLKEYWCVTSTFDDKGKVRVQVGSTLATQKPNDMQSELGACDKYIDWFNTEKEARAFAAEAKKA